MLLLPSNLRDQYGPGQYVDVSAVCNAETGIFEVSEAVAVNTTSLHAASNNERTEAVVSFKHTPHFASQNRRQMFLRRAQVRDVIKLK